MKRNRLIIIAAALFISSIILTSCYTKKNGIVPCPQGKIDNIQIQPGDIKVKPV